jgi:hypothetical protein
MGEGGVAVALEAMEGECGSGGGGVGDMASTGADTGEWTLILAREIFWSWHRGEGGGLQ